MKPLPVKEIFDARCRIQEYASANGIKPVHVFVGKTVTPEVVPKGYTDAWGQLYGIAKEDACITASKNKNVKHYRYGRLIKKSGKG